MARDERIARIRPIIFCEPMEVSPVKSVDAAEVGEGATVAGCRLLSSGDDDVGVAAAADTRIVAVAKRMAMALIVVAVRLERVRAYIDDFVVEGD